MALGGKGGALAWGGVGWDGPREWGLGWSGLKWGGVALEQELWEWDALGWAGVEGPRTWCDAAFIRHKSHPSTFCNTVYHRVPPCLQVSAFIGYAQCALI